MRQFWLSLINAFSIKHAKNLNENILTVDETKKQFKDVILGYSAFY